eukprot:g2744.t1
MASKTAAGDGNNVDMMRKMLSSYYGIDEGGDDGSRGSRRQRSGDIDAEDFDADAYAAKILRNEKLSSLLKKDNELVHAVRSINSERKMLVHENYSKFISATDTIRQMQQSVEDMEKKMSILMTDMDSICESSRELHEKFAPKREQIEKLVGVRGLLKKLEFLFELPLRLKRCIELEANSQAVKYFVTASDVLKKHLHVPSFKAILVEAEEIIAKLRDDMKATLEGPALSPGVLAENVRLLLQLGEPSEALLDRFLEWHTVRFERVLEQCASLLTQDRAPKAEKNEEEKMCERVDYMESANRLFVEDFVELCRQLGRMFPEVREPNTKFASKHVSFTKSIFKMFFQGVRNYLRRDDCDVEATAVRNDEGGKDADEDRSAKDDRFIGRDGPDNSRLSTVLESLRQSIQPAHLMVPHARLDDRVAEVTEGAIRHRVEIAFEKLRTSVRSEVVGNLVGSPPVSSAASADTSSKQDDVGDTSPSRSNLSKKSTELINATLAGINRTLRRLQPLVRSGSSFLARAELSRVLSDLVQGQMRHFFIWFNAFLEAICNPTCSFADGDDREIVPASADSRRKLYQPVNALVLACMCSDMEQRGITRALTVLIDCLPTEDRASGDTESYGRIVDIPDLIKRAKATTKRLLALFVTLESQKLSTVLRTSVNAPDWLRMKEPRGVRRVMELLSDELGALSETVSEILGETFSPYAVSRRPLVRAVKASSSRGSGLSAMPSTGLRLDIERLFAKRLQVFGDIQMKRESLVAAVLRITLKSFFESLREQTFSKNGFQQIQVDVHYFRLIMLRYVREMKVLDTLADEAVSSARSRCLDAKDIESSVIEAFCKRARAKAGF